MIDAELRNLKNRLLKRLISPSSLNSNWVTLIGLFCGTTAIWQLYYGNSVLAIVFFLCNRILDVLDGFFAESDENRNIGAYFDFVADYVIYLGIPLVIAYQKPEFQFQFLVLVSLFLFNLLLWTYPQLIYPNSDTEGQKYPRSIVEGVETTILYLLIILKPENVSIFIFLMIATIIHRLLQGYRYLKSNP